MTMGQRRLLEVLRQVLQPFPNLGIISTFGTDADEGCGTQESDHDVPAEGSRQDLVDGPSHLVWAGRKFDTGQDLIQPDALSHLTLASREHVSQLAWGCEDPLAQRIQAPERSRGRHRWGRGPHFGDDLEADVIGKLYEAFRGSLVSPAACIPEKEGSGGVGGLRSGHWVTRIA